MLQRRITTIERSIMERRYLEAIYTRPGVDGPVTRKRLILASHAYEAKNGNHIVVGYDTAHGEIRSFRLDRFDSLRLGNAAPEPKAYQDKTMLFPGAWKLRLAKPQLIMDREAGVYIRAGWKPEPWAALLRPSA